MNRSDEYQLISACDALIERRQFEEALELLGGNQGFVATWLKGKINLAAAQNIAGDFMFQNYATMEMKSRYRDILNEAYNYLYSTVMSLTEASVDIREYLNQCLWRQLGSAENELAKANYWFYQEEEEENSSEEERNWAPNPDHLIDYISEMKL